MFQNDDEDLNHGTNLTFLIFVFGIAMSGRKSCHVTLVNITHGATEVSVV